MSLFPLHPSNKVTLDNVADVVRYHRPTAEQSRRHEAMSVATEHFIRALLDHCPDCADRSSAIRHARIAKMEASAAIALEPSNEAARVMMMAGGVAVAPNEGPLPEPGLVPGTVGAAVLQSQPLPGAIEPPPPAEAPPAVEPMPVGAATSESQR